MSDFAHTFNQSRPIGHPKTNTGPSAIFNQSWPIGHLQLISAHRPFAFITRVSHTKNTEITNQKSHLHRHFGLKNQPLNPILPRDQKGVPGNGADPLLKYLAPPPLLFYFLYFSHFILLGYIMIILFED